MAWLWSLAVLAAGLGLSGMAAQWHERSLRDEQNQRLARMAERSFDAMENALRSCGLLLRSVQAAFQSASQVTAEEFRILYRNLDTETSFPSLQALGYARRLTGADGSEHFITDLVAPLRGNERLVGLDISSQPTNMKALEASRDSNRPAMSEAFQLVQRMGMPGSKDGVTIRLPVYTPGLPPDTVPARRQQLMGSLVASFHVSTLIEGALLPEIRDSFQIRVVDVTGGLDKVLFESAPAAMAGVEVESLQTFAEDIRFGGRIWRMQLAADPAAGSAIPRPLMSFALGALMSALGALLVWSLLGTRSRALALARELSTQFRESEARFRVLNELLPVAVLLARPEDGSLLYVNEAARQRFCAPDQALPGSLLAELPVDPAIAARVMDAARGGEPVLNESMRIRAVEGAFWATLSVSRIELDGSTRVLAVLSDITELRELTERLRHQATHDELTGLGNRRAFEAAVDTALGDIDRGGVLRALAYIDLDQFKLVNDTSGHAAGDELLSQLAQHLQRLLGPQDVIARLGGDEFGVLLADGEPGRARAAAERLRRLIDGFVFSWDRKTYTLSASIGLVYLDRPGLSRREVLSTADTACYLAKERGRNRLHVYEEGEAETNTRRAEMEWIGRIRLAMAEGRLSLDYQELHSLKPGPTAGAHFELLLRMRDENGQRVPPGSFIPAAERFDLMPQLDRWVVETALANFNRLHPDGDNVDMCAINLSGPTVDDENFAAFVLEALQRHRVPAHKLCFEITETAAVSNMARVQRFIESLRAVGCRFALDDFGAGMSSFGYLKNMAVDLLKIDGSFIRDIDSDPMSFSIVRAVTDIGHQIELKVIAEWVDSPEAVDLLRNLGVDYVQGFLIHKPEPAVYCR